MLNLDPSKLLVIAVVMLIVLGPDKLPQCARQIGGAWRAFSEFRQRMESEVRSSIPDLPSTTELAGYARSPAALLERLSAVERADATTTARLDAQSDLPVIGRDNEEHWTTRSHADDSALSVDSDAEKVWLEAQAPFVGDATLN
jgi:Sec-independent protein translocase protein TatA